MDLCRPFKYIEKLTKVMKINYRSENNIIPNFFQNRIFE